VQQCAEARGLEKSTASEHFGRTLKDIPLTAMLVDNTIFKGQHLIVAIGIDRLGNKVVLGLRQGAVENAAVVQDLFGEAVERGVDFNQPRLYLLDGSTALGTAVIADARDAAIIQRRQVHKIRNVAQYLPEAKRHAVKFRMRAACEMEEPADARNALYKLHDVLIEENPGAAASLVEGLDETLTLPDLRITRRLRKTLCSTNAIESGFSTVAKICQQVKRWQGSDHRLRWVASDNLFA